MNLSLGIVGLPNVGKSTLFNALLQRQAALAANYPFATIEPNVGVVDVADPRLERLAEFVRNDYGRMLGNRVLPEKIIPATVTFYDIAGLVKGASEGQGLGNAFLGHIRDVSAIVHIVRAFNDSNVIQTGTGDPEKDIEIIETELILSDLQLIDKRLEKMHSEVRTSKDPQITEKYELYKKIKSSLEQGIPSRDLVDDEEKQLLSDLPLLSIKKVIYVLNVSEEDLIEGKELDPIISKYSAVKISAEIESQLCTLEKREKEEYMKTLGIEYSSLDIAINRGYDLLNLQSYLTMGPKEVRAWTIKKDTKAPQAAGVIHTDFERGFIAAEVINYKDLIPFESLKKAKEKGLVRLEGKNYTMQEGDIVEFRFNV